MIRPKIFKEPIVRRKRGVSALVIEIAPGNYTGVTFDTYTQRATAKVTALLADVKRHAFGWRVSP